jgi:cation diffusion facilitator family transporter
MTELLLKLFVKDYKNIENPNVRKDYGLLGSFFGLITNFIVFIAKIVVGSILGLYSIIADSVNNLSDFGNNFLTIFGFKIYAKKADNDHPFGHQRMEYVISLVISCVVIALGCVMVYQGILDLVQFIQSMKATGHPLTDSSFTYISYVVTLCILTASILIKLMQGMVYRSLGKRINSLPMLAMSKDSRNDVVATTLVVVGVIITWFTGYKVDCFFTMAVGIMVIISGIGILKESVNVLLGQKPDEESVNKLIALVQSHKDALGMHDLTMHYYGHIIFAVVHVEVDAKNDVMASHELCDTIEREAYAKLNIHLTVHMDPIYVNDPDTNKYKALVEEVLQEYPVKISMHDFRILSAPSYVNIIFDLVMPSNIDDANGQAKIHDLILKKTNMAYGKPTYLVINFDNAITDFLSGTSAEKKDQ